MTLFGILRFVRAYSLVAEQRPPNPLVEVRFLVGPQIAEQTRERLFCYFCEAHEESKDGAREALRSKSASRGRGYLVFLYTKCVKILSNPWQIPRGPAVNEVNGGSTASQLFGLLWELEWRSHIFLTRKMDEPVPRLFGATARKKSREIPRGPVIDS